MAEKPTQSFENHARLDPGFHFFLLPVAALTIVFAIYNVIRSFSLAHAWFVVLAVAFALLVLKTRLYALKAQDRVIRMEERLRLSMLCSEPVRSRIPELTERQLIALRFASDAECSALVERTLSSNLPAVDIKKAIQNWRPDYFRI